MDILARFSLGIASSLLILVIIQRVQIYMKDKKYAEMKKRFATYLSELDEENYKLKGKTNKKTAVKAQHKADARLQSL